MDNYYSSAENHHVTCTCASCQPCLYSCGSGYSRDSPQAASMSSSPSTCSTYSTATLSSCTSVESNWQTPGDSNQQLLLASRLSPVGIVSAAGDQSCVNYPYASEPPRGSCYDSPDLDTSSVQMSPEPYVQHFYNSQGLGASTALIPPELYILSSYNNQVIDDPAALISTPQCTSSFRKNQDGGTSLAPMPSELSIHPFYNNQDAGASLAPVSSGLCVQNFHNSQGLDVSTAPMPLESCTLPSYNKQDLDASSAPISASPSKANVKGPGTRFFCMLPTCDSTFSRSADLNRHYNSVHFLNGRRVDCPRNRCGRKGENGFTRSDHLTEHLRSYHGEDIPKRRMSKTKQVTRN